jgi:pyrimidine-nucleoside phosphorylase
MNILKFIGDRRDGKSHSKAELFEFAILAGKEQIHDYHLAAWLMAAVLNPLTEEETAWLTAAMADSGEKIDLAGVPEPWVDKHSTGGVGDKTTIAVLPILAACGLSVVKMSGAGLGITGGTTDKLASVPGLRLELTVDEMKRQAATVGIALGAQTSNLAPADKVLYQMRGVTGTTASLPLICSSILSKKIAGGAKFVTFDVKCGRGAFMPDFPRAQALADALVTIGAASGLQTAAVITDMDTPMGSAVGNALEVREAFAVLQNRVELNVTRRFRELVLAVAGKILIQVGRDPEEASRVLESGAAWEKCEAWLRSQGAFAGLELPNSPAVTEVLARESGFVSDVDPVKIANAVIDLGGGRRKKTDVLDHAVGVELLVGVGEKVELNQPVMRVHHRGDCLQPDAIKISPEPPARNDVILRP